MNSMIPTTVVDHFFENPDMVVDFANSLEYQTEPSGRWPGARTKDLYEIDNNFVRALSFKLLNLFIDVDKYPNIEYGVSSSFQKISSSYKQGWIHADNDSILTAIIYLNKNNNINSGTSIMTKKQLFLHLHPQEKYNFLSTLQEDQNIKKAREDDESQFVESISIKNVYNRLVVFDSHLYHKAQSFDNEEERLTLVIFFDHLSVPLFPIQRMRRGII